MRGLQALFGAFRFLLGSGEARKAARWPVLVAALLALALSSLALAQLGPGLVNWIWPEPPGGLAGIARWVVRWLSSLLGVYLALLIAPLLAPTLCSPALERLIRLQESQLGVPERGSIGFWAELGCGLRAQATAWMLTAPLWLLLLLTALLVPASAPLVAPLKALLAGGTVAWNLLDYPLTLRGVGQRKRLAALRRHPAASLGFGLGFAGLFWVPGMSLLLLPAGVVGATRLIWDWAERDPALASQLGAPELAAATMPRSGTPPVDR